MNVNFEFFISFLPQHEVMLHLKAEMFSIYMILEVTVFLGPSDRTSNLADYRGVRS